MGAYRGWASVLIRNQKDSTKEAIFSYILKLYRHFSEKPCKNILGRHILSIYIRMFSIYHVATYLIFSSDSKKVDIMKPSDISLVLLPEILVTKPKTYHRVPFTAQPCQKTPWLSTMYLATIFSLDILPLSLNGTPHNTTQA